MTSILPKFNGNYQNTFQLTIYPRKMVAYCGQNLNNTKDFYRFFQVAQF